MSFPLILIMPPPPDERPDDLVNAAYVAKRFGCSTRSVQLGLCDTGGIRRISSKPLRFRRGDVDDALLKLVRPPEAEQSKRKLSLVRRKPAQASGKA
jgi:hypothetical protein